MTLCSLTCHIILLPFKPQSQWSPSLPQVILLLPISGCSHILFPLIGTLSLHCFPCCCLLILRIYAPTETTHRHLPRPIPRSHSQIICSPNLLHFSSLHLSQLQTNNQFCRGLSEEYEY